MPEIKDMPVIIITQEMIDEAHEKSYHIKRTEVSDYGYDKFLGPLGEMIFAQYMFNDWRRNQIGSNAGRVDYIFDTKSGKKEVEIKCSRYPGMKRTSNLLTREDYANRRHPDYYVQIIIPSKNEIKAGDSAYVCGWATSEEVLSSVPRDFGHVNENGEWEPSGFNCYHIPLYKLKPV